MRGFGPLAAGLLLYLSLLDKSLPASLPDIKSVSINVTYNAESAECRGSVSLLNLFYGCWMFPDNPCCKIKGSTIATDQPITQRSTETPATRPMTTDSPTTATSPQTTPSTTSVSESTVTTIRNIFNDVPDTDILSVIYEDVQNVKQNVNQLLQELSSLKDLVNSFTPGGENRKNISKNFYEETGKIREMLQDCKNNMCCHNPANTEVATTLDNVHNRKTTESNTISSPNTNYVETTDSTHKETTEDSLDLISKARFIFESITTPSSTTLKILPEDNKPKVTSTEDTLKLIEQANELFKHISKPTTVFENTIPEEITNTEVITEYSATTEDPLKLLEKAKMLFESMTKIPTAENTIPEEITNTQKTTTEDSLRLIENAKLLFESITKAPTPENTSPEDKAITTENILLLISKSNEIFEQILKITTVNHVTTENISDDRTTIEELTTEDSLIKISKAKFLFESILSTLNFHTTTETTYPIFHEGLEENLEKDTSSVMNIETTESINSLEQSTETTSDVNTVKRDAPQTPVVPDQSSKITGNYDSTTTEDLTSDSTSVTYSFEEEYPNTECTCVPYHLCADEEIQEGGTVNISLQGHGNNCTQYLEKCCYNVLEAPQVPEAVSSKVCGLRYINGVGFRISGDEDGESQYGELPWTVALLRTFPKRLRRFADVQKMMKREFLCGGSLIHPEVVLTAKHCIIEFVTAPKNVTVRVGEWDFMTEHEFITSQDRVVKEIIYHPDYAGATKANNIALLRLTAPVKMFENVGTICLPEKGEVFTGRKCFISGWGKDAFGSEGKYQVIMKKSELPVVDKTTCQRSYKANEQTKKYIVDETLICAGEKGVDACKGDGGGPLVCPLEDEPDHFVQAGIVAAGIGCKEDRPGLYVNVAMFRQWVDGVMKGWQLNTTWYTFSKEQTVDHRMG